MLPCLRASCRPHVGCDIIVYERLVCDLLAGLYMNTQDALFPLIAFRVSGYTSRHLFSSKNQLLHPLFHDSFLKADLYVQRVSRPSATERRGACHPDSERGVELPVPHVHSQRCGDTRAVNTETFPCVDQTRQGQRTRHLHTDCRWAPAILVYRGRPGRHCRNRRRELG